MIDDDPHPLFTHVMNELAKFDLAYVHFIEGATAGPRELDDRPFDYDALRTAYHTAGGKAAWMVNNGYDLAMAKDAVNEGADLVAFGKTYIANPDLVERLKQGGPFNEPDNKTFYGGGAKGYTDYPALAA
jgi:N-ethylmaleimide reductase